MINLDAFGLQKFSHRHKISVCRDKHSDIISIRPCQTDHVSDDACIYALFFRAPHVRCARRTRFDFMLAGGALRKAAFLLALLHDNMNARHLV